MVLGRHTETGQPTRLVLGSGRPTLQHRKDPGPSTGLDRERANAAAEKDNPWRSSYERVIGRKLKGTQGVASLDRGIGAGLFPEARPRGTTPRVGNRCIVADGSEARGDTAAPRCQETRGIMLPLASSSLTPDYGDELWALPALESVSVSPTYPRRLQRL
jgi:hypothetical protein